MQMHFLENEHANLFRRRRQHFALFLTTPQKQLSIIAHSLFSHRKKPTYVCTKVVTESRSLVVIVVPVALHLLLLAGHSTVDPVFNEC